MECSSWQQHVACLMCGLCSRSEFDVLSWMHVQVPRMCKGIHTCVIGVFGCIVFLLRPHAQICVSCMYRLIDCDLAVLSACFIIIGRGVSVAITHFIFCVNQCVQCHSVVHAFALACMDWLAASALAVVRSFDVSCWFLLAQSHDSIFYVQCVALAVFIFMPVDLPYKCDVIHTCVLLSLYLWCYVFLHVVYDIMQLSCLIAWSFVDLTCTCKHG